MSKRCKTPCFLVIPLLTADSEVGIILCAAQKGAVQIAAVHPGQDMGDGAVRKDCTGRASLKQQPFIPSRT